MKFLPLAHSRGRLGRMTRFSTNEDGTVTLFGVLIFILMVIIGGVAVDIARYETQRTQLQSTVDRAVLAAAALNQPLAPELVVESYLEASGLRDYRLRLDVEDDAVDERRVLVFAEMDLNTMFMDFFGIRALTTPAYGEAVQSAENIEISMVLDISGSMRNSITSNTYDRRIDALRAAATSFTEAVVASDPTGLVSVNVVPYAGHVNPGSTVFNYLGGVREHSENSCIEFNLADFQSDALPAGTSQVPSFMNWTIAWEFMDWGWCPRDTADILYASNDATAIRTYIENIRLHDGTATHIGMKYGLALLNPDTQPAFQALYGNGEITDVRMAARPAAWDDAETRKYIILMTDGRITEQVRPVDPTDPLHASVELANQDGSARYAETSSSENRARFAEICNVARNRNVVVFAIAFEAPSSAQDEMAACATSPAHYYETSGDGIIDAFQSIAATINHLRLTQ